MPSPPYDFRFDLLVESLTGYAIYMLDLEGCISTWNRGAELLKGYGAEEIVGQSFERFFTLEDRKSGLPQRLLAGARAQGKVESEGWRIRKDGSRFWALAVLQALRDDAGQVIGYAKITRDMTERREAQAAIAESDRRFRYLVEGVIDYAIYMLDPNGLVTNWNRGAERIKGYASDEIVGRHFGVFYTPPDREDGLPARALETARTRGRFEGEGWRLRKDGSRFWAMVVIDPIHDDDDRLIGFAKITRDISERKAAEEALSQSERHFRLLVNSVVDYALFLLDPNGIVTNWNAGAEKIKGYAAEEIVGQHFSKFYTHADRAAGEPLRALRVAEEKGRYEAEGWRLRKDGGQFWANVVIDPVRDESGKLIGFAKITRDITERRNALLALEKAREQMAQAQKMEAIGQLTGGIAHDFNNLLMIVSGGAQILNSRIDTSDHRVRKALDGIDTAAQRGVSLTRHLLSFARQQRLQPSVAAAGERLAGIRDLLDATLPPTVRLDMAFGEDLWPIEVDQGELELAILNLVVNARDAMPSGGVLTLRAENVPDGDAQAADQVAISVRDTGTGIAPDVLSRIFDPFFTTKPVGKGTGLGLSQVYGFARQAGGEATVDSQLGSGATFTLLLPRSRAGQPAAPEALRQDQPQAKAQVLLVEDNPEVADVAVMLMEQLGHKVQVATSAAAALQALQEGDPPDVVFSDVVMAGDMDGLDLAHILRERHPNLPVILATGYSQAAERSIGNFPLLRKPYTLDQLSQALGAALARTTPPDDNLIRLEPRRRTRAHGERS
jgi:PAS domain S-box-containing protein